MARLAVGSTAQRVETDFLYIEDNIMRWSDTIIQISNIAKVSTANIGTTPFPLLSVLVILLGMGAFNFSALLGIVLVGGGVAWEVIWYQQYEKEKTMQLLKISLNSGIHYTILFHNKKFLSEVFNRISDLISKPSSQKNLTINVKDSTFGGNASVVGSANS
ncbi:hypothetical protein SDC9_90723 [bioreactor metagenome]|uniref:Uncharacterized protein n=1 Tax=bioreactor metagenome TaxID=1076179 RepID=A0A644ZT34_9ZZZZ